MIGGAKTVNQFWSKINGKKLQSSLNPFAKERRDLNWSRFGVIFQGESDGDAQKFVAPPKRAIFNFMLTFCSENFIKKICSGVEKSNVGNRLKRVLAKFRGDRSLVRGVNGRSKFTHFYPLSVVPSVIES